MARLTVEDLHEVKRNGQKIAAAVVYEYQMTKICEMAGVDVLSVGDSLGRNMLGHDHVDECTVDDMIPFVRAGVRRRQRAVVRRAGQEAGRVQDAPYAVVRHRGEHLGRVGDVALHEPDPVFHVVQELGLDRDVECDDVLALFERIAHRERPAETAPSRNHHCHGLPPSASRASEIRVLRRRDDRRGRARSPTARPSARRP